MKEYRYKSVVWTQGNIINVRDFRPEDECLEEKNIYTGKYARKALNIRAKIVPSGLVSRGNFEYLNFQYGVEIIEENAFYGDAKNVSFSDSIKVIEDNAFGGWFWDVKYPKKKFSVQCTELSVMGGEVSGDFFRTLTFLDSWKHEMTNVVDRSNLEKYTFTNGYENISNCGVVNTNTQEIELLNDELREVIIPKGIKSISKYVKELQLMSVKKLINYSRDIKIKYWCFYGELELRVPTCLYETPGFSFSKITNWELVTEVEDVKVEKKRYEEWDETWKQLYKKFPKKITILPNEESNNSHYSDIVSSLDHMISGLNE